MRVMNIATFNSLYGSCPNLFLSAMTKLNASKILHRQSLFNFRMVFQQDVEHNCFGTVGNFEPDNLWRIACYQ